MISLDHKNDRGQAPYGTIRVANMLCYFSYDTIVAVQVNGIMYSRENSWGPTTGKHMNRMFYRDHCKEVTASELDKIIHENLANYGLDYVRSRIYGEETST